MTFDTYKASEFLKEELENKRPYQANRNVNCELCREGMAEGDDFYFIGNRHKICVNCLGELQEII